MPYALTIPVGYNGAIGKRNVSAAKMNEFGLTFHHFGLAVRDPAKSFLYLAALGYREGNACYDPQQRVNVAMRLHDSMPDVEVIWPGNEPSPIDKMLKQRSGIIYHLCYSSPDVAGSIASLETAGIGVRQISAPVPAPLFGGLEVSFYAIPDIGIIEVIQTRVP